MDELRSHADDAVLDQDDPAVDAAPRSDAQTDAALADTDPASPILTDAPDPEESIYGVNPDKPLGARKVLNPDS